MTASKAWWSLDALNLEIPDQHHDSTVENLADIFGVSDRLFCFHKQEIMVREIQRWQLIDDPDDIDGLAKVVSFRALLRSGSAPPAIVVVHSPDGPVFASRNSALYAGSYHLLEGRHRYNAACQENQRTIFAWVAHIGCCGGPTPDLWETAPGQDRQRLLDWSG